MKILLLHPNDSAEVGVWSEMPWDLIVDLGWSGRYSYADQSKRFGCRLISIYDLLDHDQHRRQLRQLMSLGWDQLVDAEGIDWWEVFSIIPQSQLEQLMMLSALAAQLPRSAQIFATRAYSTLSSLSLILNTQITILTLHRDSVLRGRINRYSKAALALRPAQVLEIALDKWDTDYRLRRRLRRSPKPSSTPVVLLPSSYVNVSRSLIAYARMLPHRRFLFVGTRLGSRLPSLPSNVEPRALAAYAPRFLAATEEERLQLLGRWRKILPALSEANSIFRLAGELRLFENFPRFLKNGLRVRDAWREVLNKEPITTVFSADEYNAFTRLPSLLAKSRGRRTVFCDHGALNMSFSFRRPASDTYLVRGEMARDYLVGMCGVSYRMVAVGGAAGSHDPLPSSNNKKKDWIVFYSEAYELSSARTQVLYAELLPELCSLARQTNRRVIIKLHPFESLRVRKGFVNNIVPPDQRHLIELREGPITPELFDLAWCSFTVESSVAAESTIHGVPCFLCSWFDASWYDYGKQFAKFKAGYPLDSPARIREIPRLLENFEITEATRREIQTQISPEYLESLLDGRN